MSIMNDLHAVGINPFGVELVAESVLKSPIAQISTEKPLTLFFPVNRKDCFGWAGVRITLEAVRSPCTCRPGECESVPDRRCRMADEVKEGEAG
jgi:hypothetical protein